MRYIWLCCFVLALPSWGAEPLRVAVASNFRLVLEQLNPAFEAESGVQVVLSSASTGVLHNQIIHGAPFDVLLAADTDTPRILAQKGFGVTAERRCYARGRLVLVGANTGQALADPSQSLAIANPSTAPYGRAAKQVLEREEFQPGSGRKLVLGNNAVQTWQFWHSGSVALALVPQSLAQNTGILVPQQWHAPIEQQALLLQRAASNSVARAYLQWLGGATVRRQIQQAGYDNCP